MTTAGSWLRTAVGEDTFRESFTDATRRRLERALGIADISKVSDDKLRFVVNTLELEVFDYLDNENQIESLRSAAAEAFQIARTLPWPNEALAASEWIVRVGCLAVLGERSADYRRILVQESLPPFPLESEDWGIRVWSSVLHVWIRLLRKKGWDDLDSVQHCIAAIRNNQRDVEPAFLKFAEQRNDAQPAWKLMAEYHLAKAAEILGIYLSQGAVDRHYDIREQLEAQFDRAINASARGQLVDLENFSRLLARTARVMVDNSIWTVTRAVNSRVTRFVESMTSRRRIGPIFEMLPPQRRALSEQGLLGSSHRSVVVSLPTSSGKTFIAEFRILQALNQFDQDRGWVAYLAPTRALVNQLTVKLRRDFSYLDIVVEKVSPALEVDGLEAGMLTDMDGSRQFRILITTPEKLDLMLRGGWEEKIGRPLTLVVVDEAHGLASNQRGIKLELLLATINRECRYAQFLLLTPFIKNGSEIARWLSPDSNKSIDLGVEWTPNDRVVAIARVDKGADRGDFSISLTTTHTSRSTLDIPETITIGEPRPLGLSWSAVANSPSKIAAATAQILQKRGTVIVLVDTPGRTWGVADAFKVDDNKIDLNSDDLGHVQRFLLDEMGQDFPLAQLLEYGIGVHHAGMSEDTRALVEWLTENQRLRALIATTTIAQGVNFPVSGVVFASHQYRLRKYPYRQDMPPEDFWNIAGRAGRVDQGDLGVVVMAAQNDAKQHTIEQFIANAVGALNSTLIQMIQDAVNAGKLLQLESLSYDPGWSAFVQYLAHTYRQIGDHDQFAAQIEQVLRGTLGFQALRKTHKGWADNLVQSVYSYAERLNGKPLGLVDATGFSWETVSNTLVRLGQERLPEDVWTPELFGRRRDDLRRMMGVLLQVPELREPLQDVTGGTSPDGDKLARIVCDWVQGRPLTEMAIDYFAQAPDEESDDEGAADSVAAMTKCCRSVFGRLTQTASWGLSALQSLTLGATFEEMSTDEQRSLRNLPARVYYGVNTDEAVALRLLGVPRTAAPALAQSLSIRAEEPLHEVRARLREADASQWTAALGERGASYHRVWSILEGES